MTTTDTIYDELCQLVATETVEAALDRLVEHLGRHKRWDDRFEARLLQSRLRLGLSLTESTSLDELPEPRRGEMEDAYLDACREAGLAWLEAGDLRRGWTYMQPVGDKPAVAQWLARIEPDEEHLDTLIQISVEGGVCPALGMGLVLEHYGTCNAITLFQNTAATWSRLDQTEVAACLVRHVHAELLENVKADIVAREGHAPQGTFVQWIAKRNELFAEQNYHLDASHLAAVVRFARLFEQPRDLRLAFDLTEYGRRLDPLYQFAGEEPFADTFADHGLFFQALLGDAVDAATEAFGRKARELSVEQHGTAAIEAYVTLLARLGRYDDAIEAAITLFPRGAGPAASAPSLLWLASHSGHFEAMLESCRQRDDVVGFVAGLVEEKHSANRR